MAKKLFAVQIVYDAYVWAEDDSEAIDMHDEITRTEDFPSVTAHEVSSNVLGWDHDCCVYHNGDGDIRLGEVLPTPTTL